MARACTDGTEGRSYHGVPTRPSSEYTTPMPTIDRRSFMATTAGASLVAAARPLASPGAPAVRVQSVRPVVVASANGHRVKNGGTKTCVEIAFDKRTKGDDVLDALIASVNI